MRYFSTFSGIGGFELGIQQAYENHLSEQSQGDSGMRHSDDSADKLERQSIPVCVGYSELDKYASQIYRKHFPKHKNYGDITKIDADALPDFDLLVGGFPCQAFSIAGKRKGFEDTRGTLFFDLARILRAKRPRLFVFENVKGLLSHDEGRTFRTIIGAIDELGYDCQWQVLNSKNHGVPQNRERVFIVGHLRGTSRPQVFPFGEAGGSTDQGLESGDTEVASTLRSRYGNGTGSHIEQLNNPTHSNDRIYGAEGVSPTLNTMQGGMRQPKVLIPEATQEGFAEATIGDSINLSQMNSKTRRGRVGKGIAQTIDTGMQQHTLTGEMKIRRLTPTECERLQGFPDGWTEWGKDGICPIGTKVCKHPPVKISDTQRYKTLGNAVTTKVVEAIMTELIK